jgi:hypothetical protein
MQLVVEEASEKVSVISPDRSHSHTKHVGKYDLPDTYEYSRKESYVAPFTFYKSLFLKLSVNGKGELW